MFQITYDGQFLKKKKEVVWVIDKRTSEMYDEYKLGSKCLWKSFQNRRLECMYCFLYSESLRKYQNIEIVSLVEFV